MVIHPIWVLAVALSFMVVAPAPSIACNVPALGAEIDRMMARGDIQKARPDIDVLRAQMASLARSGDDAQARKLEEDAMQLLGFRKAWLRCGNGTFAWFRVDPDRMVGSAPKPSSAR